MQGWRSTRRASIAPNFAALTPYPDLQDELRKQGIEDDEEQRLLSNLRVKVCGGRNLGLLCAATSLLATSSPMSWRQTSCGRLCTHVGYKVPGSGSLHCSQAAHWLRSRPHTRGVCLLHAPSLVPQPLSVQAAPSPSSRWSTKQKVLLGVGLAVLFGALVALVVSARGHTPTTTEFRGAREWAQGGQQRGLLCMVGRQGEPARLGPSRQV